MKTRIQNMIIILKSAKMFLLLLSMNLSFGKDIFCEIIRTKSIDCAKSRLIGSFDKEALRTERGSKQPLIWDSKEVGVALRTQNGINPVFVSIGHKIDLQAAINWVLKLCPNYRLPESTRLADQYVNTLMKERTEYDIFGDDSELD